MNNENIDTNVVRSLFPASLNCLPQPFAGETLYSWCARFHRLTGCNNPRATSRRLFGHPSAGLRPEQPYHLEKFQENTQQLLGNFNDLLRHRTVFGFYAPFLSPNEIARASEHLKAGNGIAARGILGMAKEGQSTRYRLRYCPECVTEQLAAYAVSWWQREQLWPTVCLCVKHECLPTVVRPELLERSSANFFLPHELGPSQIEGPLVVNALQRQILTSLINWTTLFVGMPDSFFSDAALRITYLLRAKQLGWVALDGSLRFNILQRSFLAQCGAIGTLPNFHFINGAEMTNGGFLGGLLRQSPGRRHPSKHIVLVNFLFPDQSEFLESYRTTRKLISKDGMEGAHKALTNTSQKLIELVQYCGKSVSAAALIMNIPADKALSHLNRKPEVARKRRPHVVGTAREIELRAMLTDGRSRKEIAEALSLRPGFTKDYLARHPELRICWEKAYRIRETERHRLQLMSTLQAHPDLPIKTIRRLPQNGFQWLYNNDRAWLQEALPAIWKR